MIEPRARTVGEPDPPRSRGRGRRTRSTTIAAAALVLVGTVVLATAALGTRSRAENLAWLATLDEAGSPDGTRRARARESLLNTSASEAPRLVAVVSRGVTRWYAQWLPWFEGVPVLSGLRERQGRRERTAIEILQRLGPDAGPALVPLLAEHRFGGRDTAVALLRAYGTNALPALLTALDHPDPETRAGAVVALGKFPSRDLGDLGPLRRARSDAMVPVRLAAIWAFGQMRDRPEEVVGELTAALDDPSERVRLEAVRGLRAFAAYGATAVPELRRCLADASLTVRGEAAVTLAQLGRAAQGARDDLVQIVRARGAGFREAAAALVQVTDPASAENEEAFQLLRQGLNVTDVAVRMRTLELLAVLGNRATSVVHEILPCLENEEIRDDRPALIALRHIQPDAIPERFRRGRIGR